MLTFTSSGTFDKTDKFLARMKTGQLYRNLDGQARRGVAALAAATPTETGVSAASWAYDIKVSAGGCSIWWTNSHVDAAGEPIVVMLQYGHGTGTGGYVQGRDFINPAIRGIFEEIEQAVWREVTSSLWRASIRESSRWRSRELRSFRASALLYPH